MRVLLTSAALLIAGCSPAQEKGAAQQMASVDVAEAPAQKAQGTSAAPALLQVTVPQLAYAYTLGFVLPGEAIVATQQEHLNLCTGMGAARCQLIALDAGTGDHGDAVILKLRLASAEAQRFSETLGRSVAKAGGRTLDTKVAAQDVSKQIVDTQARIAQRELLVERLTEVLRTRGGKLSELLEAERSVAQAQEELDQAKAWLAELRGRVAMSDFEIRYSPIAPGTSDAGLGTQLREAAQGSGATFLIGLRVMLSLAIYLLPWALVVGLGLWGARAIRRRRIGTQATQA